MSVALHAQARASKEMVVGSAVTMAGVRQALLSSNGRRNGSAKLLESEGGGSNLADIEIANVSVFYPFEYSGLHDRSWDLVIIEGWFGMINAFIHEVRSSRICVRKQCSETHSMLYRAAQMSSIVDLVRPSIEHISTACALTSSLHPLHVLSCATTTANVALDTVRDRWCSKSISDKNLNHHLSCCCVLRPHLTLRINERCGPSPTLARSRSSSTVWIPNTPGCRTSLPSMWKAS